MRKEAIAIIFMIMIINFIPVVHLQNFNQSNQIRKIIPYESNDIWISVNNYNGIDLYDESNDRIMFFDLPFKVEILLSVKLGNNITIKFTSYDASYNAYEFTVSIEYTSSIVVYSFGSGQLVINNIEYTVYFDEASKNYRLELWDTTTGKKYTYPEYMIFNVYYYKRKIPTSISINPPDFPVTYKYSSWYSLEIPEAGIGYVFRMYNYKTDPGENEINIYISDVIRVKLLLKINTDQTGYAYAYIYIGTSYAYISITLLGSWKDAYYYVWFTKDAIIIKIKDVYSTNENTIQRGWRGTKQQNLLIRYKADKDATWTYGTVFTFIGKNKYQEESNWFTPLIQWFNNLISKTREFFTAFLKGLISSINSILRTVKSAIDSIYNQLVSVYNQITSLLSYYTTEFTDFFVNAINNLNQFYNTYIKPFIDYLVNNLLWLWNTIQNIISLLVDIHNAIKQIISNAITLIQSGIDFLVAIFPFMLSFGSVFFAMWLLSPLAEADLEGFIERLFTIEQMVMTLINIMIKIINLIINLIHTLRDMIPIV